MHIPSRTVPATIIRFRITNPSSLLAFVTMCRLLSLPSKSTRSGLTINTQRHRSGIDRQLNRRAECHQPLIKVAGAVRVAPKNSCVGLGKVAQSLVCTCPNPAPTSGPTLLWISHPALGSTPISHVLEKQAIQCVRPVARVGLSLTHTDRRRQNRGISHVSVLHR